MPSVQVAHIREQGIDLIIVPLADAFDYQTDEQRSQEVSELQLRATAAGLRGTVVPVWRSGGSMKFIAPQNWHPYFRGLSLPAVRASLNREISW